MTISPLLPFPVRAIFAQPTFLTVDLNQAVALLRRTTNIGKISDDRAECDE
jgi:hypothetical protein